MDASQTASRFPLIVVAITGILCLTPFASPPLALLAGAAIGLLSSRRLPAWTQRLAKWLLQISVVLLGFGLDLPAVLRAGASGFLLAAGSIAVTLLLGRWLAKRFGVRAPAGRLISAGTAICGGSAIAAVGSATDADEGDMTVAMGAIFLLNAVALLVFPVVGHAMGLSERQFGVWAGVAIQDISSTVGAAGHYGPVALQTATAVKLSRALWIVPVTLAFAWRARRRQLRLGGSEFGFANTTPTAGRVQVPWFIGLFLLASVVRTVIPGVAPIAPPIQHVATIGLTLTLLLIGTGLNRTLLKSVGWRALLLGLLLWLVLASGGLLAVVGLDIT